MILCQISDTHIKAGRKLAYGVVDTAGLLERCVADILKLPKQPDAVIATGDLVDYGRPDEYGLLRELLAPLTMPLYLMPGNHDERDALRASFPEHAYLRQWEPFIQYAIDDFPVRIVALDTLVPRKGGGVLCADRLAWLDRTLSARAAAPTVVELPHPPFRTGIGCTDKIALDADSVAGLDGVIGRHPKVDRVIAGHLRPITVRC